MLTVLTPAPTHDLTLLETVKAELEVAGTADDAFIAGLIRQASGDISRYCNRVFALETVRESFRVFEPATPVGRCPTAMDGVFNGLSPLRLRRTPVVEVVSVAEDGVAVDPGGYELDPELGVLYRAEDGYHTGWWVPRVTVEYRAGYELLAGLPHEVERACIDLVKYRYFARSRDPALRSEQILDVVTTAWTATSSTTMKRGLPVDIAERLDSFRRYDL
jgi:hypothetical protein